MPAGGACGGVGGCAVRDAMELESTPLIPRAKLYGGEGTPAIDEFCVDELATLLEMSASHARC